MMTHRQQEKRTPTKGQKKPLPERTCISCRTKQPAQSLMRFVSSLQGEVLLDRSGQAPGRGVYVCYDARCLRKAWQAAKLTLALRHPVTVPPFETVCQEIETFLHGRLRGCLSLSQRAGAVVSGYAALRRVGTQKRLRCLVCAEDTAAGRLDDYHLWCALQGIPLVVLCTKEELGHLLGQSQRSAIGLTAQSFCELLHTILARREKWYASLAMVVRSAH